MTVEKLLNFNNCRIVYFKYVEVFDIQIGVSIDLNKLMKDNNGVNYIGRTDSENGVTAKVIPSKSTKIYNGGCITIPMVGNAMKSSYQEQPFCVSQNIAILRPINFMLDEKRAAFFNVLIRQDAFRFNYGRTLSLSRIKNLKLFLPVCKEKIDLDAIDSFMNQVYKKSNLPNNISILREPFVKKNNLTIDILKWRWFYLEDLFIIKKGKRLTKQNMKKGQTPFIGSIDQNNGYRDFIAKKPIHDGNTLTINYNGSVAETFYQPEAFWASDDVNVLYPKFKMNVFIGIFLCTLTKLEKYRFNYGRKWHKKRMEKSKIKLPIDKRGNPDWKFMEDYVKSLPYSKGLCRDFLT